MEKLLRLISDASAPAAHGLLRALQQQRQPSLPGVDNSETGVAFRLPWLLANDEP
ncbi:hypothetical protein SynA15127_01267 [Synechococcus sp. A15-127]|nr:hypothetical protein SynA15127_01267 [Synechococcus sp. A15-127]